jgi:hypothetical protein
MNFKLTIETDDAGMVGAIATLSAMMAENASDTDVVFDPSDGIMATNWFLDSVRFVLLGDRDIFNTSDKANDELLSMANTFQALAETIKEGLGESEAQP